jgi:hypothetical protein
VQISSKDVGLGLNHNNLNLSPMGLALNIEKLPNIGKVPSLARLYDFLEPLVLVLISKNQIKIMFNVWNHFWGQNHNQNLLKTKPKIWFLILFMCITIIRTQNFKGKTRTKG